MYEFLDSFVSIFDPIFLPLVEYHPLIAVAVYALFVSIFMALAYKFMTDQALLKVLRADMKKLQGQIKNHKDNPQKALAIQADLLDKNKQLMMQSFRPMFVTMIPVLLIFAWINTHLAYDPIDIDQQFEVGAKLKSDVDGIVKLMIKPVDGIEFLVDPEQEIADGVVIWKLQSVTAGEYTLMYQYGDEIQNRSLIIGEHSVYKRPQKIVSGSDTFKELLVNRPKKVVLDLGFIQLSGLWTYIIFSIIFSIVVRKIMGVS